MKIAKIMLLSLFFSSCQKQIYTSEADANAGTNHSETTQVLIEADRFSPPSVSVSAGTTVKWVNRDKMQHTVTSNSELFDSGIIESGQSYQHTFTRKGTYPYYCQPHAGMKGIVIVN